LAAGLEGAWGTLLFTSLLWVATMPCLFQAVKHAQQVRHGRKGLRPEDEADNDSEKGTAASVALGPAALDTLGVLEVDPEALLEVRLTLGRQFTSELLPCSRHERVLLEVTDELAERLNLPLRLFTVTVRPGQAQGPSQGAGLQARCYPSVFFSWFRQRCNPFKQRSIARVRLMR
jgi:hypothetical protein